ncbi:hypothetical protein Tco_1553122 [Tanacetum coccineum]
MARIWLRLDFSGFGFAFRASALYSSDSRVRVCSLLTVPDYANTGLLWSLSVFIRSSVIWERVHDFQLGMESYQQKINLTAPTITFPGIEEYDVFSILYEPVRGIIYTNIKKEKRVMRVIIMMSSMAM